MSGTEWEQVGTVEILRQRIYPIDPVTRTDTFGQRTEVVVEPGVFPVYRKADAYLWVMRGVLNERNEKIGDGLFVMHGGDNPVGLEVQFPSMTFGPEKFAEFLTEPICQDGPEQRLRFSLDQPVSA